MAKKETKNVSTKKQEVKNSKSTKQEKTNVKKQPQIKNTTKIENKKKEQVVERTENVTKQKGTIKLYEAIFFGVMILLLIFIVLYKFVILNL